MFDKVSLIKPVTLFNVSEVIQVTKTLLERPIPSAELNEKYQKQTQGIVDQENERCKAKINGKVDLTRWNATPCTNKDAPFLI